MAHGSNFWIDQEAFIDGEHIIFLVIHSHLILAELFSSTADDAFYKILYELDSKPGGLLSKRGSRRHTLPLEIHCKRGLTLKGCLLSGRGLLSRLYSIPTCKLLSQMSCLECAGFSDFHRPQPVNNDRSLNTNLQVHLSAIGNQSTPAICQISFISYQSMINWVRVLISCISVWLIIINRQRWACKKINKISINIGIFCNISNISTSSHIEAN